MQHIPEDVLVSQSKELLTYWNSEKLQENDKEASDPLSAKEVFVATRKRKAGRLYMSSDEDTTNKIAEMEEIEAQQNENGNEFIEAFASVMGPEHPGRLRLYGRGVTRTSLRGK
ncbi:uncharacterized protein LOC107776971 [Nicotiana tabacum]|uniref:Uncharacterized protein LOC107776971 n=1 Tax=Nicotiana tabacum TaxID=4097 RepID=A0AC58UN75_TOBAC